jgi:uncharacterized protein (TIGR02246 family)
MRTLGLCVLVLLAGCRPNGAPPIGGADVSSLRAVNDSYRAAWLAGDSAAVLRLFAADAVLLPHHGDPPVIGLAAIRSFWWPPDAPPTTVTTMDLTTEGAEVEGETGVLWGRFTLAFSFESEGKVRSLRNAGTYLMVLRRESAGEWRITHRMWDDPMAEEG